MRAAGRVAVAGAVVLLAAACTEDDGHDAASAARPSVPVTVAAAATSIPAPSTTAPTAPPATQTTASPTSPATTVAATRADYPDDLSAIAGIADTFTYAGSPVGADVAQCIGDGLVHVFGRSKVEQLGFGIGRWTLVGFSVALGPWNRPDSTAVVDTFRVCTPDWEQLMVTTAASGADHLDALASHCVADALDDSRSRDIFITLLDRPDDGTVAPAIADLDAAYSACLSPALLSTLGWSDGG
jgi:hypothetical protein